MFECIKRKEKIFKSILDKIDKKLLISNEKEAKIVALTFENTFDIVFESMRKDIKRNYNKRIKTRNKKTQKRLDKIIS